MAIRDDLLQRVPIGLHLIDEINTQTKREPNDHHFAILLPRWMTIQRKVIERKPYVYIYISFIHPRRSIPRKPQKENQASFFFPMDTDWRHRVFDVAFRREESQELGWFHWFRPGMCFFTQKKTFSCMATLDTHTNLAPHISLVF